MARELSGPDAVILGHALVQHMLERVGARGLFIKGPSMVALGLVEHRDSADVDVWVEPLHYDAIRLLLEKRGWIERPTSSAPRFFEVHSASMYHPLWPIDIDVHFTYPGVFIDPKPAFDLLWNERATVNIGGNDVACAGPAGMCVVAALHAARDPDRPRSASDLRAVATFLEVHGLRDSFVTMVHDLRASGPLHLVQGGMGVTLNAVEISADELDAWRLVVASPPRTTAFHWWIAITRGFPRSLPALLWQAYGEWQRRRVTSEYPQGALPPVSANFSRLKRVRTVFRDVMQARRTYQRLAGGTPWKDKERSRRDG